MTQQRMTKKQRNQYLREQQQKQQAPAASEGEASEAEDTGHITSKKVKKNKKLAKVEKKGDRKRAGRMKT